MLKTGQPNRHRPVRPTSRLRSVALAAGLLLGLASLLHCAKPAEKPVVVIYHSLPG